MADARGVYGALENFRKGADPNDTLERFNKYIRRAKLVFETAPAQIDSDKKKLSFIQIWGGEEIVNLLEQEGKIGEEDSFEVAVEKVRTALKAHINDVYPVYKLFCEMSQGQQKFVDWYPKVYEQAKQCDFANYTAEKAARDAMTIQTQDNRLRKKALTEAPTYANFIKAGIANEASTSQAEKMEEKSAERVNALEKSKFYKKPQSSKYQKPKRSQGSVTRECDFCGYDPRTAHVKGKCPAKGK